MTDKDETIATYVLEDSASGPLVKDAIGGIRAATACEIEQYKINRRLREENEALRLDAARYRWLTADPGEGWTYYERSLNAAIDAALAAGAGDSVSVQGKEMGK